VRIASLPNPNQCDLSYLRKWLQKCIDENPRQALDGLDCEAWDGSSPAQNSGIGDLFVVGARPKEDPFSTWIVEKVICGLYQAICRRCRHTNPDGLTINDAYILRSTSFLTTAVASLLPVGSIVVLYWVQPMKIRLVLVACFTFSFALALACFATVKRSEVFATTAAFAAVQVVFIGGNGNVTGKQM
jgi:hypothetical protein